MDNKESSAVIWHSDQCPGHQKSKSWFSFGLERETPFGRTKCWWFWWRFAICKFGLDQMGKSENLDVPFHSQTQTEAPDPDVTTDDLSVDLCGVSCCFISGCYSSRNKICKQRIQIRADEHRSLWRSSSRRTHYPPNTFMTLPASLNTDEKKR